LDETSIVTGLSGSERGIVSVFNTMHKSQTPMECDLSTEMACCVDEMKRAGPSSFIDENNGKRVMRASSVLQPVHKYTHVWKEKAAELARSKKYSGLDVNLNSGMMIGKAKHFVRLFDYAKIEPKENDQAVLTEVLFQKPEWIELDYNSVLFFNDGSAFDISNDLKWVDGKWTRKNTNVAPCVIQTPGKGFKAYDTYWEKIRDEMGYKRERMTGSAEYYIVFAVNVLLLLLFLFVLLRDSSRGVPRFKSAAAGSSGAHKTRQQATPHPTRVPSVETTRPVKKDTR
jgi:hypothetical protein